MSNAETELSCELQSLNESLEGTEPGLKERILSKYAKVKIGSIDDQVLDFARMAKYDDELQRLDANLSLPEGSKMKPTDDEEVRIIADNIDNSTHNHPPPMQPPRAMPSAAKYAAAALIGAGLVGGGGVLGWLMQPKVNQPSPPVVKPLPADSGYRVTID